MENLKTLKTPNIPEYLKDLEASGFSYPDIDLNDLRTGSEVRSKLTDLYGKYKKRRKVNSSFSNGSSILPGRDEFFVKPPVGMGYSKTVEGSTNKLIKDLESKVEDEYHDKDSYVIESIDSLADGFDESVKNYVDNKLASEVRERVIPYLEEAKEKLINDYEKKLANEIIKPGLKEFDKKFAANFESFLDPAESKEWKALIGTKKDTSKMSAAMTAFMGGKHDKYRQLENERLSKSAALELEKYKNEKIRSEAKKKVNPKVAKMKRNLTEDYTKRKLESTIKKFYKIIMS